jgi:hypothetical protein
MGHFGRIKGDIPPIAVELAVSHVAQQHRLPLGREAPEDDEITVLQTDIGDFGDPEIEENRIVPFFNALINFL